MAELKTQRNEKSVEKFLDGVENERRREDAREVLELMAEVTGEKPQMWGQNIVGFGSYRYRYASGREGEWFLVGFSPRKSSLSLYIMSGVSGYEELLEKLGRHKTGKACLYVDRLEDIDMGVLRRLMEKSVAQKRKEDAGSS